MDKAKAIYYIENSFLASLFKDSEVTDISYNGESIFYVSNTLGRKKSNIVVEQQVVRDFLRQISNLSEQQFSYTTPNLDISIGKYRINATHQSVGKIDNEDVVTFSIRIASTKPRITKDSDFFTPLLVELIDVISKSEKSIIIGGVTSSGKTEFQKYIIRNFDENVRVIVIDNVLELDAVRNESNIDLTCWKVDERNPYTSSSLLIKNALRNNPDWLILAEARDKEMVDVLNSAMTGMPIITTIHAFDVYSLPYRMGRMVLRGDQKLDYDETLKDIYYHFHFYFYLNKKSVKGKIVRYISQVGYIDNNGQFYDVYSRKGNKHFYHKLPSSALSYLELENASTSFRNTFIGGGQNE